MMISTNFTSIKIVDKDDDCTPAKSWESLFRNALMVSQNQVAPRAFEGFEKADGGILFSRKTLGILTPQVNCERDTLIGARSIIAALTFHLRWHFRH
jgi:hypothetical protein